MPADASLIQPETHGARSPHFQAPRWLVPARCEAKWPHGAHRHPFQSLFHRFLRSAIFGLSSLWVSPGGKEQFLRSGWRKRERHRELDGELLLIRAARARNVRRTKRRHGLERARRKPCGPFFYGHRSLHRPSHVPFSPIRSVIVPSLPGLLVLLSPLQRAVPEARGGSGDVPP